MKSCVPRGNPPASTFSSKIIPLTSEIADVNACRLAGASSPATGSRRRRAKLGPSARRCRVGTGFALPSGVRAARRSSHGASRSVCVACETIIVARSVRRTDRLLGHPNETKQTNEPIDWLRGTKQGNKARREKRQVIYHGSKREAFCAWRYMPFGRRQCIHRDQQVSTDVPPSHAASISGAR